MQVKNYLFLLIAFFSLLGSTMVSGQEKRPNMQWKTQDTKVFQGTVLGQNANGLYVVTTSGGTIGGGVKNARKHRLGLIDSLGVMHDEIEINYLSPEGEDITNSLEDHTFVELPGQTIAIGIEFGYKESLVYGWNLDVESASLHSPRVLAKFHGKQIGGGFGDPGMRDLGYIMNSSKISPVDYSAMSNTVRVSYSGNRILLVVPLLNNRRHYKTGESLREGAAYFVFDRNWQLLFQGEMEGPHNRCAIIDWAINDEGLVVAQMESEISGKKKLKESGQPFEWPMCLLTAKNGDDAKMVPLTITNSQQMNRSKIIAQKDGSFLLTGATQDETGNNLGWQTIRINQDGSLQPNAWIPMTKQFWDHGTTKNP
jgi:hypothetical protein